MKRSFAPSQVRKRREAALSSGGENGSGGSGGRDESPEEGNGSITIERQSFMGVLSIPSARRPGWVSWLHVSRDQGIERTCLRPFLRGKLAVRFFGRFRLWVFLVLSQSFFLSVR